MKRISSKVKITWLYTMMSTILTLVLSACTAMDVLEENNGSRVSNLTRGSENSITGTISETEALEYAKEVLHLDASQTLGYSIEYVLAQSDQAKSSLPSDTIAYVVTFDNDESVLVANSSCYFPVIAATRKRIEVKNGKLTQSVFNQLEEFLVARKNSDCPGRASIMESDCCKHYMVGDPELIDVNIYSPFDSTTKKHYPDCKAGSVPTCSALALAYTQKILRYKKVEYDFHSIIYCFLQGPGFWPGLKPNASSTYIGDDKYEKFVCSYDGSVSAFSNLIYDLGEDMYTSYDKNNSTTYLTDAYRALQKLGCELSALKSSFNTHDVWNLLGTKHIVVQELFDNKSGRKSCILITGGENIYHDDPWEDGSVLLFVKSVDETDVSLYALSIADSSYLGYLGYEMKQYFGIKRKSDAYPSRYDNWKNE